MTAFRPMIAADHDFVRSSWSASYRTSKHAGLLPMDIYADVMHAVIDRILLHPTTRTIVAEEPGEVDEEGRPFLYGFISQRWPDARAPYVYYVFVKNAYRRGLHRGLPIAMASSLFRAAGLDPRRPFEYACYNPYCAQLAGKIPRGEFNPLPARFLT